MKLGLSHVYELADLAKGAGRQFEPKRKLEDDLLVHGLIEWHAGAANVDGAWVCKTAPAMRLTPAGEAALEIFALGRGLVG